MTTGIWILGDQLSLKQAALQSCEGDQEHTPVILIESHQWVSQRRYHAQKLVLVWSAMRHFAASLRQAGWQVTYEVAEDFVTPLQQWVKQQDITELRVMFPSDKPLSQLIRDLDLGCTIQWVPHNLFLWTTQEFQAWAQSRKRLLMEDFYRQGRTRFDILMDEEQPIGGKWNFDKQNRKPPKKKLHSPDPLWFEPDAITQAVIKKVEKLDTYGEVQPFRWGVTRQQALAVLAYFIRERLPDFGTYQDAMVTGETTMWHALLSPYLNLGLLQPGEVLRAAENAYNERGLAINSIEGFIRQVLGWREYMHGLYHFLGEDYPEHNWFDHTQPLPSFYWDSQTKMNCLHQCLRQTETTAYAHHIQRLMVLSNFALIAGVSPQALEAWFHAVFIDAYDWVMQTNVIGMGQFADGGILASKPYASSANYINKMSNYCQGCEYDQNSRVGENACPFNFFYWDFLIRHRDKLKSQGRMNLVLSHLKKLSEEDFQAIQAQAQRWWDTET